MPELPEVETICRGLRPVLEGRRLARVEQRRQDLRYPLPERLAERLEGRRVKRVARRAKFILLHLDSEEVLLCHLGMSGRLLLARDPLAPYERHDHVILTTEEGQQLRYNDARRFGFMKLFAEREMAREPHLATLGPEPLGNGFNGPVLAAALAGRRQAIKAVLLDQTVVAGLGNIYASEALFLAGLSPRRRAMSVTGLRAERLASAIREVLELALAAGGSSLRDYVQTDGELGYFQHRWAVYGREGEACPACDCDPAVTGGVRRLVQAGRSTFFCARRQR